jgi:hypothetical protein
MEAYAGRQFVGMDLHRRRSVLVRMTAAGEVLERVRIVNDVDGLAAVIGRAGESPEVVLEATYGWYWAVDALREQGARVHLAHPLGVKAFEYRRVKNDERDAADLADLLRMGRLPEAWIAPPATRELRELVRHRAKLVGRTLDRCHSPHRIWSDEDWERIQLGYSSRDMDEKWDVFTERGVVFLHRSWTGHGLFEATFAPVGGCHLGDRDAAAEQA